MAESSSRPLDLIMLEVLNESFVAIVREMRASMVRTAYSSIIYEGHDFSCALVDGRGQLVAMAEDNPVHIFPIPIEVGEMLERFEGDIHPGDVFLHNDPYTGGTHLNDVAMISPLFDGGEMTIYPVVRAHWGDVGGTTPGSISGKNTEIFHDGIRIPLLKVIERGKLNRAVTDLLFHNMRVPDERRGDFFAMLATCHTAHQRLGELAAQYDWATLIQAKESLLDRSEAPMRRRIKAVPDGEYVFEHFMDHAGHSLDPLRIRVRVVVSGDGLRIDFSGTDPQVRGAYNVGPAMAPSASFAVIKAFLDPHSPINHGAFRPLEIVTEPGSLLSARYPASCAGSMEVSHAVVTALIGAAGQMAPDAVTGDLKGTSNHFYIGGNDPRTGEAFLFYEYPAGGTGGFAEEDGNNATRNFTEGDFSSIQSIEVIEHAYPLQIKSLELRRDSGGPGFRRGGLGLRRVVAVLAGDALLSISSDKNIIPPFGVFGGGPGSPNRFTVLREDRTLMPSDTPGKVAGFRLGRGDRVVIETSGGGGYGDPLEREPERVAADVREGYVSPDEARGEYGVHLTGEEVDEEKTRACRQAMKDARRSLPLIQAETHRARGSRRLCSIGPDTAADLGLEAGALVELKGRPCAPLRAWIEIVQGHPEGQLGLDALGMAILQGGFGGSAAIRLLSGGVGG